MPFTWAGGADFWLMRGAQQPLGLELLSGPAIDIVADVQALPFRDATFDAIVALEVLEHVPKPGTMADEMRRVLKPGGHVLLSTPFVWKMHRTPKDYWRFTRDSLEMIFRAYSSVQVHAVNGARETLMHVLYQYVEVFLDVLKLPKRLIYALKPVERIVYAAIPRERTNDPLWTTGWFVVARK